MKRISMLFVQLVLILIVLGSGCGKADTTDNRTGNQQNKVNDVLAAGMAAADSSSETIEGESEPSDESMRQINPTENASIQDASENASTPDSTAKDSANDQDISEHANTDSGVEDGIDVDLTAMSGTMVYSEVYNMLSAPDKYIGKRIKMDGAFNIYHSDSTGKDYFSCMIKDATACCAQGMEFILTDDYSYPDDYPEAGENITVTGVFDTYKEGDYQYCTLRDASLEQTDFSVKMRRFFSK